MSGAFRALIFLAAACAAGLSAGTGPRVAGFSFGGVSNRFITPNGDGKNDDVAFHYSNPRDSAGTVKIYDLRGHLVTTLALNPGPTSVVWDARAAGQVVPSGMYIYVIEIEDVVASGSVVVVR